MLPRTPGGPPTVWSAVAGRDEERGERDSEQAESEVEQWGGEEYLVHRYYHLGT